MNAITLGSPNLFVKGVVEAIVTDPATGNIIGYDTVASESAITSSINLGEVTGGFGNPLLINIPDTTRITGTLTSQAFSMQQRALISGGSISYNAVSRVCETIEATGTTLTVTRAPALAYGQSASDTEGWCYVREHGADSFIGTNYGVDLVSKTVSGFVATSGKSYDVIYFTPLTSSEALALPTMFNPTVATISLKFGVYAKQNNSVSNGTLQGYVYFIVPRAQFTGDVGLSANQTGNATTAYDWTALSPDSAVMACSDCSSSGEDYAYYVYVPCAGSASAVKALAVYGAGVSVSVDGTAQVPVVYIMDNGSVLTPTYTDLEYVSETPATAEVSESGLVTGKAAGETEITVTLQKSESETLTAVCNVTVTA